MIAWKLWTSVPKVELWEAVALVLDIEPRSLKASPTSWMAGPGYGPIFDARSFPTEEKWAAFVEAFLFAKKAATYGGPISLPMAYPPTHTGSASVSLREVVAFFVSCEWPDIPAPLLALVAAAASTPTDNAAAPVAAAVPSFAQVGEVTTPPPLTTPDIADAFDGIGGQTARQWRDKLGDVNNHHWLIAARALKAKAPSPATWWPIKFAELLLEREASADSLNRAFLTAPKLKPWLPLWQEKRRDRNAFGQ